MRNATRVRPTRPLPQHSKLKSKSSQKKIRNDTTLDQTTCLTGRVQEHYTTLPTIYYAHYCINSEVYMDLKKQLCVELRLRTKEDEVPVHIIFLSQFSANTLWGLPCYSKKNPFPPSSSSSQCNFILVIQIPSSCRIITIMMKIISIQIPSSLGQKESLSYDSPSTRLSLESVAIG